MSKYLAIPKTHLNEFIGQQVHVTWAKSGSVWKLEKVREDSVVLKSSSGKTLIAGTDELTTTANNQDLLEPWFTYLLECADGTLYCGITNNLSLRVDKHNGVKPGGARYTKSRRPVKLLKSFGPFTKSEASKLEYQIKQLSREEKLKLCN